MALRVWGRNSAGGWVAVVTQPNGNNDQCYVTALCQAIKLSVGESPFYSNVGISAQQSIAKQVYPDYEVSILQSQYAQYFASLTIQRVANSNPPQYNINLLTNSGTPVNQIVAT